MKKGSCALLAAILLTLVFPATASATYVPAAKIAARVTVDAVETPFEAYTINSNNYFRLRDIAYVLSGTEKQFEVTWDAATNEIHLVSGAPYTPVGLELAVMNENGVIGATPSSSTVYLDGKKLELTGYHIGANHYYKLRDLGAALDFSMEWDGQRGTVAILSALNYAPEPQADEALTIGDTQVTFINNWAWVSSVQQFLYRDEGIAYAYASDDVLEITTPGRHLSIPMEYSMLGDVRADDEGNFYIVWGRAGSEPTEETVFISKYSPQGVHIKTVGFVGESIMGEDGNTQHPFNAGGCSSAIGNGRLMVNYARTMYNGHQSNNVIGVKLSNLSPVRFGDPWEIPYTSHSFSQSVIWSELADGFIYADQGDAYDRGFVITAPNGEKLLMNFYLEPGANYNMWIVNETFAQLGGLGETSKGVVLAGASAKSIGEAAKTEKQNLFVQIFKPNVATVSPRMFLGGTTRSGETSLDIYDDGSSPMTSVTDYGVHWLTDYTTQDLIAPQVVVDDDRIVLLWATLDTTDENWSPRPNTFYMVLSAEGEVLTPATSLGKAALNSFEAPIYHDGAVHWVAADHGVLQVRNLKV